MQTRVKPERGQGIVSVPLGQLCLQTQQFAVVGVNLLGTKAEPTQESPRAAVPWHRALFARVRAERTHSTAELVMRPSRCYCRQDYSAFSCSSGTAPWYFSLPFPPGLLTLFFPISVTEANRLL